ncbi:DUF4178 domain-containing protein [candidate division KSB1 bacterium]|nr:DUF4178 domain-containing protein [candidate division KSB1 bacterium]
MGWNIFGKKKQEDEFDALRDVQLKNLGIGWMVDYDMKTWEVVAHHKYDWGGGSTSEEWELRSSSKTIFLEYDPEDEGEFTISWKIPVGKIEGNIKEHLRTNDDAPGQIVVDGVTYYLDEDGGGLFLENCKPPEKEFIYWDYVDDSEENIVTVEQWGDNEFEAYLGKVVEEYQFENILPAASK